jgi:phage terminase Nu1 subunit (DNA packaging protein)
VSTEKGETLRRSCETKRKRSRNTATAAPTSTGKNKRRRGEMRRFAFADVCLTSLQTLCSRQILKVPSSVSPQVKPIHIDKPKRENENGYARYAII